MTAAEEERPGPVPPAVRGLALPWWRARSPALADLLEKALEQCADGAEVDRRWRPVEWLAGAAEAAAMVARMEAEAAADTRCRVAS